MQKITKLDYCEAIQKILISLGYVEENDILNLADFEQAKDFNDYMYSLAKLYYEKFKKIGNVEVDNVQLKKDLTYNDILSFLENEINRELRNSFYDFISDYHRNDDAYERIFRALDEESPKTCTEISENDYYLKRLYLQVIAAKLDRMVERGFVGVVSEGLLTRYYRFENEDAYIDYLRHHYNYLTISIDDYSKIKDKKITDETIDINYIKNDSKKLIEYIQSIIDLETDIMSLKKRYNSLQKEYEINLLSNYKEYNSVENLVKNERKELCKNIKNMTKKVDNKPKYSITIKVDRPVKPKEPVFNYVEPNEPVYLTPGLFNKKSIEQKNNAIRLAYENQVAFYNSKVDDYYAKVQEYEVALIEYENELVECEERENKLNKEKYLKELEEYEKEKKSLISKIEEDKKKMLYIDNNYLDLVSNKQNKLPNYMELKSMAYEMDYIRTIIEQNIELKNKLLSKGVIYTKYRDFVALSRFCDYFLSGRCSELDGANGAYNLYEQEIRTDYIMNKLDKIESSLEEIKNNQLFMYNELKKMNASLEMINGQLLVNNILEAVQVEQLGNVINNLDQINYNTRVAAFYAQKSANYQKSMLLLDAFFK